MRLRYVVVLVVGCLVLAATPSAVGDTSGPVLDQSFTSGNDQSAGINDDFAQAQTFTAGRTGTLAGVSVDTRPAPSNDGPMRVSVRNTHNGLPGGTVLATTVLETADVPLSRLITFPQQPQIRSGVRYAIVVDLKNLPTPVAGWLGSTGNGYPRGMTCASADRGVTWQSFRCTPDSDLHFQTYLFVESCADHQQTGNPTAGNDVIVGTSDADTIGAEQGDDFLCGRSGGDTLGGAAGDDLVSGNKGNDTIRGGSESDQLYGGWGDDTLRGGDGADVLVGNADNDTIAGGPGNDTCVGGPGDDTFVDCETITSMGAIR